MFIAGQYYLGHLKTDAPFIDYGVFFTPAPREEAGEGTMPGTPAYDNGPWMYVVNADSSDQVKQECWKFLRWLTSDEVSVEIAKEGACIFRDSAIEIAKTELDEVLRTFLEAQKYVHPRTPKYWRFLVTRFPPQIQSLLLGQKSILDAVTTAEDQINEDIRTGKGKL
jgi:ABC-type glycerol-3-phosphate transport system substrate-binding protein